MNDTTEKSADSTNDEWIVDGDLYLIKTISRYPILWDRKNFDSDQRNEVWLKLSKKLNIKLEWMKKRWSYLREQYVRHLKQINNVESDKSLKKNYKYFNEMSFLANHIQIRNGNYQEVLSSITQRPVGNANDGIISRIESIHRVEGDDDDVDEVEEEEDGVESENVDFVITENEIEAYNDDDNDNLFIELSDEENDPKVQPHGGPVVRHYSRFATESTTVSSHLAKSVQDSPAKRISPATVFFEEANSVEPRPVEEHLSANHSEAEKEVNQRMIKSTDARCEDVIFGELVTSMLKKMDSPNRKRAKKEILNILLS